MTDFEGYGCLGCPFIEFCAEQQNIYERARDLLLTQGAAIADAIESVETSGNPEVLAHLLATRDMLPSLLESTEKLKPLEYDRDTLETHCTGPQTVRDDSARMLRQCGSTALSEEQRLSLRKVIPG